MQAKLRLLVPDVIVLAFLLALTSFLAVHSRHNIADDAFIYLRMSNNIVAGLGWAFNPHDPVNAATSPFYALLVAAIALLHLPGIGTMIAATVLGLFTLGAVVYFGSLDRGRMGAAFLGLGASTFPLLLRTAGLETSIYLACLSLTALTLQRKMHVATGLLAGLTALGRPEGIAILPIVLAVQLLRERKVSWKTLLVFACTIAPWMLFSLFEFHTLVPHTMKIKHLQSNVGYWAGSWFEAYLRHLPSLHVMSPFAIAGIAVAMANLRRRPFLGVLILFGGIQVAGYSILKAPVNYFWYFAPGSLAYMLAVILGMVALLRYVADRVPQRADLIVRTATLAMVAVYLLGLWVVVRESPEAYRSAPAYEAAGSWIRDHSGTDDWVACNEIGYLGYFSGRKVRDMLGLLEVGSVTPLSQHRWDWWFTDDPKPRFIVVHEPRWIGEPGSSEFPWAQVSQQGFTSGYQQVFMSGDILVFEQRQD
jgi:hypothetical protein